MNGRINKKYEDEMLKYIYDNCDKYDRKYSLKYDKTIEKVGNIYYKNNINKYVYIYSEKKLYESNLDELIAKIDKYIIFKIKNINYLCLCTETEIQILSFTINNEKCYIKLYQTIKFKKKIIYIIGINAKGIISKKILKYIYYMKVNLLLFHIMIYIFKLMLL